MSAKPEIAAKRLGSKEHDIRWHVVDELKPDSGVEWVAACGIGLLERVALPTQATKVPVFHRCMRPGCRGRWLTKKASI
jgi:hypothetical protein